MRVLSSKEFQKLFVEEYEEYTRLYEIVKNKQEAIINNDIQELAEILKEEQAIIEKIEEMEEAREKILNQLALEKDIDSKETITFTELMELMPAERVELEQIKEKFLQLLDKLQELNQENRELIEHSLKITESSLEFIREATGRTNLYNYKNDETNVQTDHIIDKRV
ncbi:MAG: flagellar protein FlgN [Halanaerobiales bacterium]